MLLHADADADTDTNANRNRNADRYTDRRAVSGQRMVLRENMVQ
jgi:hypothetical protein